MPDIASVADGVIATVKAYVDRQIKALPKPVNGKDADIADLIPRMEAEIAKRVEALPDPAVALVPFIDERVADAVAAIEKPQGVTVEQVMPALLDALSEAVATLPKPENGKDADPEVIRQIIAEALAEIPKPEDGKSFTAEDARPVIAELVAAAVSALPPPADGKDATPEQVEDAVIKSMSSPTPPALIVDWLEAKSAAWALDFERRAQATLERAADRIPKPADGMDGFSLDDLSIEDDGNGRVTLRFHRGDLVKSHTVRLPRFSDKGVFRDGDDYEAGDGVTWAGSYWIAQKDSPEGKPGDGDSWRLAVKRGRDGKDGRMLSPNTEPVKL